MIVKKENKEDVVKALAKMWIWFGNFIWILGSTSLILADVMGTDTDHTLLFSIVAYGFALSAYFGYRLNWLKTMELEKRMEKLEHAAELE